MDIASPSNPVLRISCDDCSMAHSDACADCLVTFICTRESDDAVLLQLDEHRALRRLSASGLLPEMRHQPLVAPPVDAAVATT